MNYYSWIIDRARAMFPKMQDEVFDLFLRPLITTDMGWPYSSVDDVLISGSPWYCVLHPFSLRQLAEMGWTLEDCVLDRNTLAESCVQDLELVWQNYQGRLPRNMPYDYDDCRSRTQKQLDFIRENGRPSAMPVVAADYNGKLKLFDGNHRIVAAWQSGFLHAVFKVWKGCVAKGWKIA